METAIPYCLFFTFSMFFSKNHRTIYLKQVRRNTWQLLVYLPHIVKHNKKYPLLILLDQYLFDPFHTDYGAYWDDLPRNNRCGMK
jgi:enterochelin esterase-like enzyme